MVKHAYFDEFVEGKSVIVTGFTSNLDPIYNLPIVHILYEFDKDYGNMVLLEYNNTIYIGDNIIDYFANPNKYEDNDMRVNLFPKLYYPNINNAQSINFSDGNSTPVEYYGVLSCIAIRKPTKYEVESCEQIALTSNFDCDPCVKGGSFSNFEARLNAIVSVPE